MAPKTDVSGLNAQKIGNVFTKQYYAILQKSPNRVSGFYHNCNSSQPGPDGVMSKEINAVILSSNNEKYQAEIKTVEAQFSNRDGVVVLAIGCLTRKGDVGRQFTQSFYLAPQDKGYYVLNDVLKYFDEGLGLITEPVLVNRTSTGLTRAPVAQELDNSTPAAEELGNGAAVYNNLNIEEEVVKKPSEVQPLVQEDAPQVQAEVVVQEEVVEEILGFLLV